GGTYNGSQFPATATVAGIDGHAGSNLEGVGLSLNYVRNNPDGSQTNLGATAPSLPGNYTVTASFAGSTDYDLASAQTSFTIILPPTLHLVFIVGPMSTFAGFNLNRPIGVIVTVEDALNSVVPSDNSTITMSISSGPAGGAFTSGSVVSAV